MKRILLMVLAVSLIGLGFSFNNVTQTDNDEKLKEEVWKVVKAHNRAWTVTEDIDEQAKYVHENVTFMNPSDKYPVEGKEAYLEGYKKWYIAANVHFFNEIDHKVKIFGNGRSAVVTYNIDMAFNYEGNENTFKGRDMFFLVKENGKWLIVADDFSPYPNEEGN